MNTKHGFWIYNRNINSQKSDAHCPNMLKIWKKKYEEGFLSSVYGRITNVPIKMYDLLKKSPFVTKNSYFFQNFWPSISERWTENLKVAGSTLGNIFQPVNWFLRWIFCVCEKGLIVPLFGINYSDNFSTFFAFSVVFGSERKLAFEPNKGI